MSKNPHAAALGRLGGRARAESETDEQRKARMAAVRSGRRLSCECGECRTCKAREYQRKRRANKR
jgi:hypothetical protein